MFLLPKKTSARSVTKELPARIFPLPKSMLTASAPEGKEQAYSKHKVGCKQAKQAKASKGKQKQAKAQASKQASKQARKQESEEARKRGNTTKQAKVSLTSRSLSARRTVFAVATQSTTKLLLVS